MRVSETRLSRPFHDGLGWVVGASNVDNRTRQQREYGAASFQAPLTGVTNRITEMTGYGEATVEILPSLVAAGSVRLSHARLGGSGEAVPFAVALAGRPVTAHRPEPDLLPSLSPPATPPPDVPPYTPSPGA